MIKITREFLTSFRQLPRDAGQLVDVSYAVDRECERLVCRTIDRGIQLTSYEVADIDPDSTTPYEPWNGLLPGLDSDWEPCEIVDYGELAMGQKTIDNSKTTR